MSDFIEKRLNYDFLIVEDESEKYFGGDQDWYKSFWKRLAGCGPTTASTITMYETRKIEGTANYTKLQFIDLMNTMWQYVTPREKGVSSTDIYTEGYDRYIKENSINLSEHKVMNIEPNGHSIIEVFEFLSKAIDNNHPIAFLNLDNGGIKALESWHWVTIVGISYNGSTNELYATIADGEEKKEINLGIWLEKTTKGGGFVYYI